MLIILISVVFFTLMSFIMFVKAVPETDIVLKIFYWFACLFLLAVAGFLAFVAVSDQYGWTF